MIPIKVTLAARFDEEDLSNVDHLSGLLNTSRSQALRLSVLRFLDQINSGECDITKINISKAKIKLRGSKKWKS